MAHVDGIIGRPPDFVGTDVTVDTQGPDGVLLSVFTDFEVPPRRSN